MKQPILKCIDKGDDTIVGIGTLEELEKFIPDYCRESGAMRDDLVFVPATVQEINTDRHNSGRSDKN